MLKSAAIEVFDSRYEINLAGTPARARRVRLHWSAVIGLRAPIGGVAVRQNLKARLRVVAAKAAPRQTLPRRAKSGPG